MKQMDQFRAGQHDYGLELRFQKPEGGCIIETNTVKKAFSHRPSRIYVHVVSDATGTGAERMARAALVHLSKRLEATFIRHCPY